MFEKLLNSHVKVIFQQSPESWPFTVDGKLVETNQEFIALVKCNQTHYQNQQNRQDFTIQYGRDQTMGLGNMDNRKEVTEK